MRLTTFIPSMKPSNMAMLLFANPSSDVSLSVDGVGANSFLVFSAICSLFFSTRAFFSAFTSRSSSRVDMFLFSSVIISCLFYFSLMSKRTRNFVIGRYMMRERKAYVRAISKSNPPVIIA